MLIGRSIGQSVGLVGSSVVWPVGWTDQSFGPSGTCSVVPSVDVCLLRVWWVGGSPGRVVGWLVCLSVEPLICWLAYWQIGWSVGRTDRWFGLSVTCSVVPLVDESIVRWVGR